MEFDYSFVYVSTLKGIQIPWMGSIITAMNHSGELKPRMETTKPGKEVRIMRG